MKHLSIAIVLSTCQVFGSHAQAGDYCYSWDCDSSQSLQKDMGSNQLGDYGDKGKESQYADKFGKKKKTPSSCDKHKKSTDQHGDPAKKDYIPCLKLY